MKSSSVVARVLRAVRSVKAPARPGVRRSRSRPSPGSSRGPDRAPEAYPGDFTGTVVTTYAPDLDGDADPGEIVWTWIPYEEDHSRGKDRPALVVGHDGPWLLALMLTSRDHDAGPARREERWLDLGVGDWDRERRPSEVRLDRVIRVDPASVRREGAVLDRSRFDQVADSLVRASG